MRGSVSDRLLGGSQSLPMTCKTDVNSAFLGRMRRVIGIFSIKIKEFVKECNY